jgi:L,D-peptidoglycan transpeptidase YkuD (ErfK/YbiS/YcfS/YnhG family)
MKVVPLFLLLLLVACENRADVPVPFAQLSGDIAQAVVVITKSWSSPTGTLQKFERTQDGWRIVGDDVAVTVGRNGLAWGRGLHQAVEDGIEKVEGDGKAPAGVFSLGVAFGYDPLPPEGVILSYRQATDRDIFVDDPESLDYNRWVTISDELSDDPKSVWHSFERMKRDDHLYELGITIRHNVDPVMKGKGSAIFFHIWRDANTPTAGCTAMAKDDLSALMRWLDPNKNPIIIAAPVTELDAVKTR